MATSRPKTPTSSRYLVQHNHAQTTPTRQRSARTHAPVQAHAYAHSTSNYLPRRNSWEDEIQVTSLPDPRTPEHLSYNDIWKGPYAELAQDAAAEFMRELQIAMRSRPGEYRIFHDMLQRSARENSVPIDEILDMACVLFGHNAETVAQFNGMLPPGYRMEAHQNYIAVFTPDESWFQFPDGSRQYRGAMSSSAR
ncbi:hypothetical protein GY45DRAFT_1315260 [Cubamyces sp. BRFM 1775]|nr:hypothetical protein GY45DRAFT_1315260 [Cubamyces sp. BRFM 1775]